MENKFISLGDMDNRFSVAPDSKSDAAFIKSVHDNIRAKTKLDAVSDALMTGLGGGPNVTRVRDSITGDEFALMSYSAVEEGYDSKGLELADAVVTKYAAAEIKNGVVVGSDQDAYRKMGIPTGLGLPESQPSVVTLNTQDLIKPENLRRSMLKAQEENRINLKDRAGPLDYRGAVRQHYKVIDGLASFIDEAAFEVRRNKEVLERIDIAYGDRNLSFDEQARVNVEKKRVNDVIEKHKIDGTRAVISPGLFEIDKDGKAFLSDSADLSNRFAQVKDSSMIPLTDVEGRYSIGKVSQQSLASSPNIKDGDTVLSSIRVKTSDSSADTNIYTVNDGNETWIRAERVEAGVVTMSNGDALGAIGIDGDKLLMGGEHTDARISAQIAPRALREHISEAQIKLNAKIMTDTLTDESASTLKASSLATDTQEAVTAKEIDGRWTVEPLTRIQISDLEALGVIPGADKDSTAGYDYAQTYSAIVVTDNNHDNSAGPRSRIVGQSIINSDYNSGPGQKKTEVVDYEVFMPAVNDTDNRGMGWVRGDTFIDSTSSAIAASLSNEANNAEPVYLSGKPIMDSYAMKPENIMQTLLDSEQANNKVDPKMTNKYGLGGIDSTILAHQAQADKDKDISGFDWGVEATQEAAAPKRRNTM